MATTVGHAQIEIAPELNRLALRKFEAALKAQMTDLERQLKPQITPGVNLIAYRKKLQQATAKAGEQKIKMAVDAIAYRNALKAATARIEAQKVKLDLDLALYQQRLRAATARAAIQEVNLKLRRLALYRAQLAAATRPTTQTVNLQSNTGGFRQKLVAFLKATGASLDAIAVKLDVNTAGFRSKLFQARRSMGLLGLAAASTVATFAAIVPPAAMLAVHLAQAVPAALALGPALGAVAQGFAAFLPTFIGVSSVLEALEKLEALENAPHATESMINTAKKNIEVAMFEAGEAVSNFAVMLHQKVMPAVQELREEIADVTIPLVQEALENLMPVFMHIRDNFVESGKIMGTVIRDLAREINTTQWKDDLFQITAGHNTILEDLGDAAIDLAFVLRDLYVSVLPQSIRFAEWLKKAAQWLRDITEEARKSGALEDFFERAGDRAAQWGRIVANVAVGLFNLFSGLEDPSQSFADSLERVTEQFREWSGTKATRERVQAFFQFLQDFDWVGLAQRMAGVAAATIAVQLGLAALTLLANPLGLAALALTVLGAGFVAAYLQNDDFRDKVNTTARNLRDIIGPAFATFGETMREVGEKAEPLADAILEFAEGFASGFFDRMPDIEEALVGLGEAFGELGDSFTSFNDAWEERTGESFAEFLGDVTAETVIAGIELLTVAIKGLAAGIETLALALEGDWKAFGRNIWENFREGFEEGQNSQIGANWADDIMQGIEDTSPDLRERLRAWSEDWQTGFFDFLGGQWHRFWYNDMRGTWNDFAGWLGNDWSKFWRNDLGLDPDGGWFSTTMNALGAAWSHVWQSTRDTWNAFTAWLGNAWSSFWRGLFLLFEENLIKPIKDLWHHMFGNSWMLDTFNEFVAGLTSRLTGLTTLVTTKWSAFTRGLGQVWSTAWQGIRSFFSQSMTAVLQIAAGLVNGLAARLGRGLAVAKGFAQGFIKFFTDIPGKIKSALDAAVSVLKDLGRKIKDAIPGIGSLVDKVIGLTGLAKPSVISAVLGALPTLPTWATGGYISGPGGPTADMVPAMLSDGEYVIRAKSVEQYGPEYLDAINRGLIDAPGYASGGVSIGPSSPGALRGDSGVWRGIVRLIQKWGNPNGGHFSNAYRHGDPLWHGSGLALDWGGFNQDKLAGMFMAIGRDVLELIHSTNKSNYGISRGRPNDMGSQLWREHKNHIHVAMSESAVEHHLGEDIPTAIGGLGGGVPTWRAIAEGIWNRLKGAFNSALRPLNSVPFGPAAAKLATGIPEKMLSFLDGKDPVTKAGKAKLDAGGWLAPGVTAAANLTGEPEAVLTARQWSTIYSLALDQKRGGDGQQSGFEVHGDLNVTIPAKDLKEMRDINDFFDRVQQESRKGERSFA